MYKAKLVFWDEKKGGRASPPVSGFRPHIEIDDIHTSCIVSSDDGKKTFNFDIYHNVKIELMFPNEYGYQLNKGDSVRLFEGNKQIAEGTIESGDA